MGSSRIPFAVGACVRLVEFPDLALHHGLDIRINRCHDIVAVCRLLDRFLKIIIRIQIAELTPMSSISFNNSGVKCRPAVGAAAEPSCSA